MRSAGRGRERRHAPAGLGLGDRAVATARTDVQESVPTTTRHTAPTAHRRCLMPAMPAITSCRDPRNYALLSTLTG